MAKKKVGDIDLLFCSRAHKLWGTGPIPTELELDQDSMHLLVTCKFEEAQIKNGSEKTETLFSHYNYMAFFSAFKGM